MNLTDNTSLSSKMFAGSSDWGTRYMEGSDKKGWIMTACPKFHDLLWEGNLLAEAWRLK